jgi:hypothetical protein
MVSGLIAMYKKTRLFLSALSLCLSRACLGKMVAFVWRNGIAKRRVFLTFALAARATWVRGRNPAEKRLLF